MAILAIVLVGTAITVSAGASQTPYRVEIFTLTEDNDVNADGFAVGIRVQTGNSSGPQRIAELTAHLTDSLRKQITEFVSLDLIPVENDSSTQALLFVARFTEQVSLERIAKAVTPVFEEFARTQVQVSFGSGPLAKLTED